MMENKQQAKASGLSGFFSRVYAYVGLGVGISALVSYLLSTMFVYEYERFLYSSPFTFWGLWIAQLALVFYLGRSAVKDTPIVKSIIGYVAYSVLTGVTLTATLLVYTGETVTSAFITTAVTFGVMAVFGMVTKKDLSGWGHALISMVLGIIIAMLLNVFILRSEPVELFISLVTVVVFAGLTAYDNQKIKALYYHYGGSAVQGLAIYCALMLYLDIINLFLAFLRIFGRD